MTAWRNDFSEEDLHNLFMSDVFNPDDSVESVKRLLLRVAVRLISTGIDSFHPTVTHLATSNKSITPTLRRAGDTLEENIKAVKQHGVEPHTLGSFSLKKRSTSSHLSSEGCFDPITVLEQDILSIGALDLAATLERHQQLRMLQKRKRTSSDAAEKTNRTVPFNTMEHGVKHSSRDTKPSRLTFVGTDHYNRLRRRRPPSSCGLPLSPSPNPHSPLSSPSKRFYRTPSIKKAEAKRTENACSSDCWASVEKDLQSIYRTWTETRPFPDIEKIIEDESLSLTLLVSSEYKPFSSDSIRSSLKPLQALAPGTGPDEKSDTNVFPKAVELPRIKDGSNRVTTGVLRALRTAIPKPDRKELNAASNPKLLGESLESIDFSLSVLQTCRKWEVHTDLGMECVARALRLSVEIALVDEFLSSALKLFTKLKDTERDRASNHITVAYLLAFLYKRFEEAQSTELGPSNKQAWERVNSQISELLFSLQCLITVPDANSTPRIPYERSSYFEGVEMTATLRGNQVESGSSSTAHDVTQDDGGSFDACLTAHVQGIQQLVPLYLLCSVACDKIKDN
ncbi:uncharacterized protein EI97DRAFT_456493 [Westerdykella ornata]|uniref:Uncharacterized protein n=1 Tax=Westerdykella ornata TaxID=318751 RepID=A0A6A6JRB7_WESOR|nr:uncharacterized protein EI97DRAFT_456493 [Westerdykella ornata]KAF2279092.1 hypothetical protein EI97DRAFT_456493 [Westerdykella ornata]